MADTTCTPDVTDRFTTRFIRDKAKELIADGFFQRQDLDDLIQDLTLAVIEAQARNYDPQRAKWTTFVKAVVEKRAISLCRLHTAECRDIPVGSLSAPVKDETGEIVSLGNTVCEDEGFDRMGVASRDEYEAIELALDVQTVIETLPPHLQELCHKLQTRTVAQAARDLRLPRTTVSSRVAQIREHFAAAGLDRYLSSTLNAGDSHDAE